MILADTSVWIDHLRYGNPRLKQLLLTEAVACHPFVIGELACENLGNREEALSLMHALPSLPVADAGEMLYFIDSHRLMGRGLGLIDMHLLASAELGEAALWTLDKRLRKAAQELDLDGA
jgi:predicted nucleic acid-binding protein